jgi:hypothetical protein
MIFILIGMVVAVIGVLILYYIVKNHKKSEVSIPYGAGVEPGLDLPPSENIGGRDPPYE